MELRIEQYKTPEQIIFNYEELKQMLIEKASHYETIVYTEDQIQDAKADRANLNRLKKALNDERIKREKEYMTSFNVFKAQVNEIIGIIDKPVSVIDRQIKAAEERAKEEKREAIKEYFELCLRPEWLKFEQIFNEKWLNTSVTFAKVRGEIDSALDTIDKDLAVIENLPAYAFEAKEVYTNTLDLGKAISESNRLRELAEKKAAWEAEQEKRKAEAAAFVKDIPPTPIDIPEEPIREWVKFQAFMSVSEAKALGQYMREHGIKYKSV